jgi:hypothetical protein
MAPRPTGNDLDRVVYPLVESGAVIQDHELFLALQPWG